MFPQHRAQIAKEAREAYPLEAVWLITAKGCQQVENVHPDPEHKFRVSDSDLLAGYQEGLLAVVHSHPDGPDYPSEADMRGQVDSGVAWGIICTDGHACLPIVWWGGETPVPPLLERGFRHGVTDCYSLIRDYYRQEWGIVLPEFPRNWGWWHQGQNLYQEGFSEAGFRRFDPDVEKPKAGDMWFSQIRSEVPNHGGIYLGDSVILHHVTSKKAVDPSRLSKRESIGRWVPHITFWLRHKELE